MIHDAGAEFLRRNAHQGGFPLSLDHEFRGFHAEQGRQPEIAARPLVIKELLDTVELDIPFQNQEEPLRTDIPPLS